jgi:hypothetical protein
MILRSLLLCDGHNDVGIKQILILNKMLYEVMCSAFVDDVLVHGVKLVLELWPPACPSASLCITNPTRADPGLNPWAFVMRGCTVVFFVCICSFSLGIL